MFDHHGGSCELGGSLIGNINALYKITQRCYHHAKGHLAQVDDTPRLLLASPFMTVMLAEKKVAYMEA
jgi:hypothetical protein